MDIIKKLWRDYIKTPYPHEGHVDDLELEILDTTTAGCISTFISNNGMLDHNKIEILQKCISELDSKIGDIPEPARNHFIQLHSLGEVVLRELPVITNGTITLRPFTLDDAQEHLADEDENMARWLSGGKSTLESVQDWIKKNQMYWKQGGPIFAFTIVSDKKLVGMIEANTEYQKIEGLEKGEANLSYGIYPFARGNGYGTKAVLLG